MLALLDNVSLIGWIVIAILGLALIKMMANRQPPPAGGAGQ